MDHITDHHLRRSIDASFVPEEFIPAAFEAVAFQVDQHGWDQPWSLWGIINAGAWVDGPVPLGSEAVAIGTIIPEGSGYVHEELFGCEVPNEVFGVILAIESWTYPSDDPTGRESPDLPAGMHPRRREVRTLLCVLGDGRVYSQLRFRDGEIITGHGGDHLDPLLMDMLRRIVGVACPQGDHLVAVRSTHLLLLSSVLAGGVETGSALMISDPAFELCLENGVDIYPDGELGEWLDAESWCGLNLAEVVIRAVGGLLDPDLARWAGPDLGARWLITQIDEDELHGALRSLNERAVAEFDEVYRRRVALRT